MGLRLIDGRWISERDTADAPPVVVISEAFAKEHFPGERAIGRRLRYFTSRANAPPIPMPEIVGIVSDVRSSASTSREPADVHRRKPSASWQFVSFFVRADGDPRAVISSLPAAVRAVDPERPLEDVRTLDDLIADSTLAPRALSALLGLAALVALFISSLGVYGVTAATTAARKRELAIRAAIGADRAGLLRLVVGQGMLAATVGVVAGVSARLWPRGRICNRCSTRFRPATRGRWPELAPASSLICWVATYLPARRALTASPAEALRAD